MAGSRLLPTGARQTVKRPDTVVRHPGRLLSNRITISQPAEAAFVHRYGLRRSPQLAPFLQTTYDRWDAEDHDPGQIRPLDCRARHAARYRGGVGDPRGIGPEAAVDRQLPDCAFGQRQGRAQALVVARLLRRVREHAGQALAGEAKPSRPEQWPSRAWATARQTSSESLSRGGRPIQRVPPISSSIVNGVRSRGSPSRASQPDPGGPRHVRTPKPRSLTRMSRPLVDRMSVLQPNVAGHGAGVGRGWGARAGRRRDR